MPTEAHLYVSHDFPDEKLPPGPTKDIYRNIAWHRSTATWESLLWLSVPPLIARFIGPTWGPSGADRTQVGPMLAPWTLLSRSVLLQFDKDRMYGYIDWSSSPSINCLRAEIHRTCCYWILVSVLQQRIANSTTIRRLLVGIIATGNGNNALTRPAVNIAVNKINI